MVIEMEGSRFLKLNLDIMSDAKILCKFATFFVTVMLKSEKQLM